MDRRADEQSRATVSLARSPETLQILADSLDPNADSMLNRSRPAETRHDIRGVGPDMRGHGSFHDQAALQTSSGDVGSRQHPADEHARPIPLLPDTAPAGN